MRAHWSSLFLGLWCLPALVWADQSVLARDTSPENQELFVKSFFPEKWDEGITVEIYGSGFLPPSQGKNRVCLLGQMRGPYDEATIFTNQENETILVGEEGTELQTFLVEDDEGEEFLGGDPFCIDATYSTPNRIVFSIDESFIVSLGETIFGKDSEEDFFEVGLFQRSFSGALFIETETKSGDKLSTVYPPLKSQNLRKITLLRTNARKAWRTWVRASQIEAATRWLEEEVGVTLVPGSLEVSSVERGSKAKRLKVKPISKNLRQNEIRADGDFLYTLNGKELKSLHDFAESLSEVEGAVSLTFWSEEEGEKRGSFTLLNYQPPPPANILAILVLLLVGTLVLLLWVAPFAGIITVIERKIGARMQSRVGPNRVGPQGFLQWLADGLKVMQKEDLIPDGADPVLFRLAPYLMFIGMYATFVVIPFSQWLVPADLNVGLLYLLSVTSLVVVALIMSGWASNSKWALLGGMRAAAQMISYEIPTGLSLLTVIVMAGSLSLQDIILAQGGAPWNWFIFRQPAAFVAFFFFFTSALAEANRPPFDLPEAESELVAGYNTEYSGFRFLAFWFAEYANYYIIAAIATAVFLGGWRIPGISPEDHAASIGFQVFGMLLFMGKALALVQIVIWMRWTMPRMRVDQLMLMCWKYLVPLSLFFFLFSAVWTLLIPPASWVQFGVSWILFLGGVALVVAFIARAIYNFRSAKAEFYANPFI